MMKHNIDPNNDYVAKMIFARQQKSHILLHFLNSVIEPSCPIVEVYIQDPHKQRQTEDDKLTVADSLVKDTHGNLYQIEIQNTSPDYLSSRITYMSHAIYSSQLGAGEVYSKLRPIHSIWLLNTNMFPFEHYRHLLEIKDYQTGAKLPHSKFYLLEMAKWQPEVPLEQMTKEQLLTLQPIHYWLYFMQEAKNWLALPAFLHHIPIMRELMDILEEISDRSENYARYLSAQDALRVKLTDEHLKQEAEKSLAMTQEQLSEAENQLSVAENQLSVAENQLSAAEVKIKQYREKLIAAGIDPDAL